MKTIIPVNTVLPTIDDFLEYDSGESLQDYDIVLFNPQLPYQERINFSGGGSCVSIEGAEALRKAMSHWSRELKDALQAGKTVFFLLNNYETDSVANSYSTVKNNRTYNTSSINNYDVLPIKVGARNAKGRQLNLVDGRFKGINDALKEIAGYRVIIDKNIGTKVFTTKNGEGVLGTIINIDGMLGSLVLLPYFSLAQMYEYKAESDDNEWTDDALRLSKSITGQLVAIDKALRTQNDKTPAPDWLSSITKPKQIIEVEREIEDIETKIMALEKTKNEKIEAKDSLLQYSALLYESGKPLENTIEDSLRLFGYQVENYRNGDVEIDHVIVGPSGLRMIGESEGKDRSAIDITKFRQLESNIGEDFEREEITTPAKGILFGNGYRFTKPDERQEQFTEKCLTNARRLHTALVRTSDLYIAVLYILDNPEDGLFKEECRKAIEETEGEIVSFPKPTKSKAKDAKK